MKDHRQGNDLAVLWSILKDGEPFDLRGRSLKLYLKNLHERKEVEDFSVTGNKINWTFYGKDQDTLGKHSLILVVNEDKKGMITTDACDFVRLVSCSCKLQGGEDAPNVETESIELTTTLEYVAGSGQGGDYDDTALWNELEKKVDKVEGLGLSEENYTTEEKEKLSGLENYNDSGIKEELAKKIESEVVVDTESTEDFEFGYDDTEIRQEIADLSAELEQIENAGLSDDIRKLLSGKITEYTTSPGYVQTNGTIKDSPLYEHTDDIFLVAGSVIRARFECWMDQAAIAYKESLSDDVYEVLIKGKKTSPSDGAADYEYTLEKSGYISVSFALESGLTWEIDTLVVVKQSELEELKEEIAENNSKVDSLASVLDLGNATYIGNDFERISDMYITPQGEIKPLSKTFISKPIFLNVGASLSISVKAYSDMATIARSDENGVILEVLSVGGGTEHAPGVNPQATYTHDVLIDGYYVVSGSQRDDVVLEYTSLQSLKLNEIEAKINSITPDNLLNCQFVSLNAESAVEMANWTGQEVIDNIYETLRAEYPQYIKRKSIGKSGGYDIWLYEFCNSAEDWFSLDNVKELSSNILLPSTNGLTSKQTAILKTTFDNTFTMEYANLYPLSTFAVRKPVLAQVTEQTISGNVYKVLTCEDDIKVTNGAISIYWTTPIKTYDQHAFIVSGVHADEQVGYIGTALSLKYMIEHNAENPVLSYIFNNVKLSVVPILNAWGANQTPKVRDAQDGTTMNRWTDGALNTEQSALLSYVDTIKDDLSFFFDNHTAEHWTNYGMVYAIADKGQKIIPGIVSASNYLCRHWFPNLPAFNWNVGSPGSTYTSAYMRTKYGFESATIEFCGGDLVKYASCEKWDAQYMTFAIENYINFLMAALSMRVKTNVFEIKNNPFFAHITMT